MFIADAHCDTLYSIAIEKKQPSECVITPKALAAAGGAYLQTFALFTGSKGPQGTPYQDGLDMLAAAPRLGVPVLTGALPENPPETPTGIFSCEGGEMLEGSIARLDEFQERARLRMIALTWNHENEIGFPATGGTKNGLKPFGLELLRAMDARGVLADVSHLNEAGFWDVVEHTALPPIASHSDCRWLCDVPRNLTKEQVKALIERGGFIGVNFFARFLTKELPATLDDVVRHIDALCELGAEDVIGFGSDFDGISVWPEGLGDPSGFPALIELLRAHGYSETVLEDLAGMNLWRLLKRAEASAQ